MVRRIPTVLAAALMLLLAACGYDGTAGGTNDVVTVTRSTTSSVPCRLRYGPAPAWRSPTTAAGRSTSWPPCGFRTGRRVPQPSC